MFPATFLNFGPACSAIFLLWSFGEINQLELSIYLDIYGLITYGRSGEISPNLVTLLPTNMEIMRRCLLLLIDIKI